MITKNYHTACHTLIETRNEFEDDILEGSVRPEINYIFMDILIVFFFRPEWLYKIETKIILLKSFPDFFLKTSLKVWQFSTQFLITLV